MASNLEACKKCLGEVDCFWGALLISFFRKTTGLPTLVKLGDRALHEASNRAILVIRYSEYALCMLFCFCKRRLRFAFLACLWHIPLQGHVQLRAKLRQPRFAEQGAQGLVLSAGNTNRLDGSGGLSGPFGIVRRT